ncbi:hypothetical protein [Spirosoma endbachense]|uniref:Uncharacterized protein n=1 Tax=Spirosoma endbachense TaxID=2666025 RepID=A0A6P1WAF0_9BACT|nr:hypothetical protein [Spirosoma endbachense]QHW01028.1 hypothetical protein GJR95_41025 [Spirosoma endbachense]
MKTTLISILLLWGIFTHAQAPYAQEPVADHYKQLSALRIGKITRPRLEGYHSLSIQ